MAKDISIVHHADRRRDVTMPYAPGIIVRRGQLVFLSGVTAAAVYHSHPHREEEFDLPPTMREQAVLVMENLKKTLEAAGCTFADLVAATRSSPTSPSRTISTASGPPISAITCRPRRRSRSRVWPPIRGASSRSPRSPWPTPGRRAPARPARPRRHAVARARAARARQPRPAVHDHARLCRARHDGRPHGAAATRRGPALVGYNRTPAKAQALVAAGLKLDKSPRGVPRRRTWSSAWSPTAGALAAIALGPDGVIAGLRPGAAWVEMSTVGPERHARAGRPVAAQGATLIDAPVSGSSSRSRRASFRSWSAATPPRSRTSDSISWRSARRSPTSATSGLAVTMKIATNLGLAVQMLAFSEAVAARREVRHSTRARGRGPAEVRHRLADDQVPRTVRPGHARGGVVQRGDDPERPGAGSRARARAGVPLPRPPSPTMLTAARGLGLADYDFAVVFDVIACMSGLRPSAKKPR